MGRDYNVYVGFGFLTDHDYRTEEEEYKEELCVIGNWETGKFFSTTWTRKEFDLRDKNPFVKINDMKLTDTDRKILENFAEKHNITEDIELIVMGNCEY